MLKVTLRGLGQHKIRFIITTLAVIAGVSFVVGAFVLTDSVRHQFDELFANINQNVDLSVRGTQNFEGGAFSTRPPVPADLLDRVKAVPGVAAASGSAGGMPALAVDASGSPVRPMGGPPLGQSWPTEQRLSTLTVVDGRAPESDGEAAFDVDLASRGGFAVDQQVQVQTPAGPQSFTLVGTFKFGESNALTGATLVAFTTEEAQRLYNLEGRFNEISVAVADRSQTEQVRQAIEAILPPGTEVVTTAQVINESQKAVGKIIGTFGNVLLGFGGVTLFVAAFLISNIFTIVVGQRVRELALLRAIGASSRQVATSVLVEAGVVGVLSSVIGMISGSLIARLLLKVMEGAGFGAGGAKLVLAPRSFIVAALVGVGVTVVSAVNPAWRATTVPPVAAMRDGYTLGSVSMRVRMAIGVVCVVCGGGSIGWSLFTRPDTVILLSGVIGGALAVLMGVAAMSPAAAPGVAGIIGWPFAKVWGTTGLLARQNAARNPRRTSSAAAALMIGLALISTALVVGSSLKESFRKTIGSSITADWYVSGEGFFGFSPDVVSRMQGLDELTAVTGARSGVVQIDGSTKRMIGLDYAHLEDLFDVDLVEGSLDATTRGLMVQQDPARDMGIHPGDELTVVFNDSGPVTVPVAAVFRDSSVMGNWVLDEETFSANFVDQTYAWAAARTAPGVDAADARRAIATALKDYPDVVVQDRAEFTKAQSDQLDQLLVVINVFLAFAVVIAFMGITLTLLLSVFERTRELGLLRAVGMSRRQVRRMVRLEAVIVAVFGAVLGVLVGLLFGLTISDAIPEDVISTIVVPTGSLVVLVVVSGLVGLFAALWPARRASRLDVLDAIAAE